MAKWDRPNGQGSLDMDMVAEVVPIWRGFTDPPGGASPPDAADIGVEIRMSGGPVFIYWGTDADSFNTAYGAVGAAEVETDDDAPPPLHASDEPDRDRETAGRIEMLRTRRAEAQSSTSK